MAVLDIQRRGQQIGRIRIGQQVQAKGGKMRPSRLDTFRLTTQSKPTADAVAALYGGTVREWAGAWEIITGKDAIGVTVPPRDQVVSQFYEMWTAGGCQRRCDSQHEQISNGPCLCPHASNPRDEDEVARKAHERADLAKQNPPRACKLTTRISVILPDLPGLGVWRLDTGSYYAGVEIGDAAKLMEMARDKGVFLPAILRIEQRSRVAGGETKKYPVPVLEVTATFRQIANGELEAGGIAAQLPPAPGGQPKAITAGTPQDVPGPAGAGTGARASAGHDADPVTAGPGSPDPSDAAENIAARARAAATAGELTALGAEAVEKAVMDEYVSAGADGNGEETFEPLRDYLRELWREKGKGS